MESPEETDRLNALFMPFSLGKRNCLGQNLALMEMRTVIAAVFGSFTLTHVTQEVELDYDYNLIMMPKESKVTATARKEL
jgi:cytochrome P450